jgi:hypothetical protein
MKCASWVVALCLCSTPAHALITTPIPEECGSGQELEAELQRRLGPNVDVPHITVSPEGSGYRLIVEVGGERREIHDQSCQELLRAAVVVSLALTEPKHPEEPVASPEPVAPATPRRPVPSHDEIAIAAGAGLHVGMTPKPALLVELDAQLRWARFGIASGLRYLAPSSTIAAGHGVRVSALGAFAAGTVEPWPSVQARLGVVGYRLFGTGFGGVQPAEDSAWEVAPLLGANFTPYRHPPFWASIGAEGQLNLIRPSFEVLHYEDRVFRAPWLSGSAFAHAGVVW